MRFWGGMQARNSWLERHTKETSIEHTYSLVSCVLHRLNMSRFPRRTKIVHQIRTCNLDTCTQIFVDILPIKARKQSLIMAHSHANDWCKEHKAPFATIASEGKILREKQNAIQFFGATAIIYILKAVLPNAKSISSERKYFSFSLCRNNRWGRRVNCGTCSGANFMFVFKWTFCDVWNMKCSDGFFLWTLIFEKKRKYCATTKERSHKSQYYLPPVTVLNIYHERFKYYYNLWSETFTEVFRYKMKNKRQVFYVFLTLPRTRVKLLYKRY